MRKSSVVDLNMASMKTSIDILANKHLLEDVLVHIIIEYWNCSDSVVCF